MTVITTTNDALATAYSNQRKVDRCQNGVLWAIWFERGVSNTYTYLRYSTDNGATWAFAPAIAHGNRTYAPSGSLFIDLDDYAHLAYRDSNSGGIHYRRGTPNASRTSYTWSDATAIWSPTTGDYPDVVAHREGSGWRAHVVFSRAETSSNDSVYAARVDVTSGGVISVGVAAAKIGAASYGNTVHKWPSIDFNHTGDGKTVAGGTPHLYAAWSSGQTGAGHGIRFRKATYSGGSWTWGTEREIDSTRYVSSVTRWLNCLFDGTRAVLVGGRLADAGFNQDQVIYERDAADTTTTTRVLIDNETSAQALLAGSASYDANGNIYLFGAHLNEAAPDRDLVYRKWTRATTAYGPEIIVDPAVDTPYISTKRGHSGSRIEFIYTDGAASPHDVTYGSVSLNAAPNAPILTAPADGAPIDRNSTNRFDWDFSDPDAGDSQSKYDLRYRVVGAGTWTDVTGTIPNTFHDFAAGTFAADGYEWQVRTYDAQGMVGPYSSSSFFTAGDAPDQPTWVDPINGQTVSAASYTGTISAPDVDESEWRLVADSAGVIDEATVLHGPVLKTTGDVRSHTFTGLTNGVTVWWQARTKFGGLWSQWAAVRTPVAYTPPPAPTVTPAASNADGAVSVTVSTPTPGAGEPTVTHVDHFVRDPSSRDTYRPASGIRWAMFRVPNGVTIDWLAASGINYEYQAVAHGDNGTTAASAWTPIDPDAVATIYYGGGY